MNPIQLKPINDLFAVCIGTNGANDFSIVNGWIIKFSDEYGYTYAIDLPPGTWELIGTVKYDNGPAINFNTLDLKLGLDETYDEFIYLIGLLVSNGLKPENDKTIVILKKD